MTEEENRWFRAKAEVLKTEREKERKKENEPKQWKLQKLEIS